MVSPDIPLGSAEQFLLTLSSITELSARLQLWAFKMDYELTEKVKHISCFFFFHFDYMQMDLSLIIEWKQLALCKCVVILMTGLCR